MTRPAACRPDPEAPHSRATQGWNDDQDNGTRAGCEAPSSTGGGDLRRRAPRAGGPRRLATRVAGRVVTRSCSGHADRLAPSSQPPDSSASFVVVAQLRIVMDLYSGLLMTLFSRLFVRCALSRCE